jgi:hypothetical protein
MGERRKVCTCVENMKETYRGFGGKHEERRTLGRPGRRWGIISTYFGSNCLEGRGLDLYGSG